MYAGLLPGFVVASFGLGTAFVTATTTALGVIEHHEAGLASGVINTFHEAGGSIGVAVVSTIAAAGIESGSAQGFTDAFTGCALAAAVSSAAALGVVPRGKPQLPEGAHVH